MAKAKKKAKRAASKSCYVIVYTFGMRPRALRAPKLVPFKYPASRSEVSRVRKIVNGIANRAPGGTATMNKCGPRAKVLAGAKAAVAKANKTIRRNRRK